MANSKYVKTSHGMGLRPLFVLFYNAQCLPATSLINVNSISNRVTGINGAVVGIGLRWKSKTGRP